MNISPVTATVKDGVAIALFSVNGQERYVKAHHESTTTEEMRRDVQKHIDYATQLPEKLKRAMLEDYGDVVFW
jgi:hypothetical protein